MVTQIRTSATVVGWCRVFLKYLSELCSVHIIRFNCVFRKGIVQITTPFVMEFTHPPVSTLRVSST